MLIRGLIRTTLVTAWCAAALTGPAAAQDHDHATGLDRLGTVVFPVSCAPAAQTRFTHAMAVLHSFWWEEGDPAFDAVLEADSTCAMAWWGKAMNAWNNPFAGGPAGGALTRGAAAAERAVALGAPTPRERGFIAAAAALYRDAATTTNAARLQAYADTMARLHRDVPNDVEVAIYRALALVATAPRTDTTFARQKQAAAILNPLFAAHPDHPGLAHYIIHSNDSPALAHLGLDAARRYATIAPAAPHAQHMPSHIFVRLGLWDETVSANWRSYQAGVDYAKALGRAEVAPHEFHALDYAVYGHLQRGRDSAALALVALADSITTSGNANTLLGGYNGTALRARIPLERNDWKAAAAFPTHEATNVPMVAALSRFTRGIGAARSGNPAQARLEVAALDSIATLLAGRDAYWARVVGIKRDAVRAWVLLAEGDTAGAVAQARAAADLEEQTDKHPVTPAELLPARELEGDMLLALGRYAEARAAYQATLARERGRARSTFGAARAAELARDRTQATIGYRAYLELMNGGDGKRPELEAAKAYLAR
jgi:tetratricopeptide (TPR) repeat protein